MLSLMILKDCVMEPDVTKTVSYLRVSSVMITFASGLVIYDSFRQDRIITKEDIRIRLKDFIDIKNNAKRAKEEMRLKLIEPLTPLLFYFPVYKREAIQSEATLS